MSDRSMKKEPSSLSDSRKPAPMSISPNSNNGGMLDKSLIIPKKKRSPRSDKSFTDNEIKESQSVSREFASSDVSMEDNNHNHHHPSNLPDSDKLFDSVLPPVFDSMDGMKKELDSTAPSGHADQIILESEQNLQDQPQPVSYQDDPVGIAADQSQPSPRQTTVTLVTGDHKLKMEARSTTMSDQQRYQQIQSEHNNDSDLPPPIDAVRHPSNVSIPAGLAGLDQTSLESSTNKHKKRQPSSASNRISGRKRLLSELSEAEWQDLEEGDLELPYFTCPRCGETFESTQTLFAHMRKVYPDPTICKICDKQLNCMANILSHSYLHSGEKPYRCPKCNYGTRTRFNLKVHMGSCCDISKFKYSRKAPKKERFNNGLKSDKSGRKWKKPRVSGGGGSGGRGGGRKKNSMANAGRFPPDVNSGTSSSSSALGSGISGNGDHGSLNGPPIVPGAPVHGNGGQTREPGQRPTSVKDELKDLGPAPLNRDESCVIKVHFTDVPPSIQPEQLYLQDASFAAQGFPQPPQVSQYGSEVADFVGTGASVTGGVMDPNHQMNQEHYQVDNAAAMIYQQQIQQQQQQQQQQQPSQPSFQGMTSSVYHHHHHPQATPDQSHAQIYYQTEQGQHVYYPPQQSAPPPGTQFPGLMTPPQHSQSIAHTTGVVPGSMAQVYSQSQPMSVSNSHSGFGSSEFQSPLPPYYGANVNHVVHNGSNDSHNVMYVNKQGPY